jgi:hypothetical protein
MLRKFALLLAFVASAAWSWGNVAEAMVADSPLPSPDHLTHIVPLEHVQWVWGGARYCWFDNGWRGPGFYQCGNQWTVGIGWGGGWGWNSWGGGWNNGWNGRGWHHGMRPPHRPGHRPGHRPPGHRPPGHRPPGHRPPGHGGNRPGHGGNRPGHGGNRPGHGGNRPGGGGGRPGGGGGHRPGGGGGGNRRRTEIPSAPRIVATATFDYASAGAPPYAVVVHF